MLARPNISSYGRMTVRVSSTPTRTMAHKAPVEKKQQYQPIVTNRVPKDPMAYIYEKDAAQRMLMKQQLQPQLDPTKRLPFKKIPDTSTKFQLRIRKPGSVGPGLRGADYTLSPVRIDESIWAYDESEDTKLLNDRKEGVSATDEATTAVLRDEQGRVIDDEDSGYLTLQTAELVAMATGKGRYRPDSELLATNPAPKKLELEVDGKSTYSALLGNGYIPDVDYVRVFGSVRLEDRKRLPSFIANTPIYDAAAARVIGLRYMQNDMEPIHSFSAFDTEGFEKKKREMEEEYDQESQQASELSHEEIARRERQKEEEMNRNMALGLEWMARAAHAGDYQACGILAAHAEDKLSEFLGFVEHRRDDEPFPEELENRQADSEGREDGEEGLTEMPAELRDAVIILHDDAARIVLDKVMGNRQAVPDIATAHPLLSAMHYHEQSVLLSETPEALAAMAEWVLGLDELLYQCVDENDLEKALEIVNKSRSAAESESEESGEESSNNVIDIDVDKDSDEYYQPHAIMGLYLYWFVQPLVRFSSLAPDAAVLLARLSEVYDPSNAQRWAEVGRELNGMTLEARLKQMNGSGVKSQD